MSDITQGAEVAPVSGEAAVGAEGVATATTPEATGAEPTEQSVSGDTYTVTIDGEQVQVTRDELLNGYQRQADYTRKTQELAAQRKAIAQAEGLLAALRNDPEGTVRSLAEEVGLNLGNQDPSFDEQLDPEQARIRNLERAVEQQQQFVRQQQIERDLAAVHDRYGEFEDEQLFAFALKHSIPDLDVAFQAMNYETAIAQAKAQETADEAARVAAKKAAAVVEGGSPVQAGAVTAGTGKAKSVREAYLAALETHGS